MRPFRGKEVVHFEYSLGAANGAEGTEKKMIGYMANLNGKFSEAGQEAGQTIVEYALILAMFSVVMIASLGLFEGGLTAYMKDIVDTLAAVFSR